MTKKLIVDEGSAGKRFDVAATEMLPILSRAYVHVLIEGGRILLNGGRQKAGYKLRAGDTISTDFDKSEIDRIADIDLPVIYEDENVLVINKPEGVISHSRGRYWNEPSVASFVRQKTGLAGGRDTRSDRAGIVHRLDRATSGVMICAKNSSAMAFLQKQFASRSVRKIYVAVVSGPLEPDAAIIDMPIERNPKLPSTFRVGSNGKPAKTQYSTIEAVGRYSVLKLEPQTGRTHQLRVHLAQLGHPILGDVLYGGEIADRLCLHALSISIRLPGGKLSTFDAPLPDIFKPKSLRKL